MQVVAHRMCVEMEVNNVDVCSFNFYLTDLNFAHTFVHYA